MSPKTIVPKLNLYSELWRLELLSDSSVHATTQLVPVEYPLGSRLWNVTSPVFAGQLDLNLNSCDDLNSFSCRDGACIAIEQRYNIRSGP